MKVINNLPDLTVHVKELYEYWQKHYPDIFKKLKQQNRVDKLKRIFND